MRRYLDVPLFAFCIVMLAAASITAHGTEQFYSYILPPVLAYAATTVLTLGIPLLELAAVLDASARPRYIAGMLVGLGMEVLAQYFQGQAIFTAKVAAQFPEPYGVDLATFAQQPWGRLLPVIYLAVLSGVVVYFGYAASMRVKTLRDMQARATTVQPLATVAQAPATEVQAIEADVDTPLLEVAPDVADVVYLRDVLGLPWQEVGNRLSITRQAAQARYERAKRAVQARKG